MADPIKIKYITCLWCGGDNCNGECLARLVGLDALPSVTMEIEMTREEFRAMYPELARRMVVVERVPA